MVFVEWLDIAVLHVVFCGRSAVRRSFVRNRGLLFFIPGVVLLVTGILVIVSSPLSMLLGLHIVDYG